MLVACALLIIVVGLVMRLTNQTTLAWRNSTSLIQSFQEARAGFEAMTRNISQATLNTYYDYYDSNHVARSQTPAANLPTFAPISYDRISDLHFISGKATTLLAASPTTITTQTHAVFFQAPLGYSVTHSKLDNALNACGYFLQFDDAASTVPDYIKNSTNYTPRYRYRLMEMQQKTEDLTIYDPALLSFPKRNDWFTKTASSNSRVLAENVIALILLPKLSNRDDDPTNTSGKGVTLAPNYNYNSRINLAAASDADWPSASPSFPPDQFTAYPSKGGTTSASRHHQLPPLLRVVMIVIDEPSALRIQGTSTTPPAALDLASTNLFKDASLLESDIQAVEDICNAKSGNLTGNTQKLVYRVFNSDLIMREAKWSNN
jgi:uncharacterized protein (TIGR02599 family)